MLSLAFAKIARARLPGAALAGKPQIPSIHSAASLHSKVAGWIVKPALGRKRKVGIANKFALGTPCRNPRIPGGVTQPWPVLGGPGGSHGSRVAARMELEARKVGGVVKKGENKIKGSPTLHPKLATQGIPERQPPAPEGIPEGLGIKDRFKLIVKEYGKVALLSHGTIWGGSLAVTYGVLQGMDMELFLSYLPHSIASHIDSKAGAFAVAFVLTKLTGPGRLMIDIAITPTLAGYLRNTWLAGPLGLRASHEMAAAHPMGAASRAKPDSYRVMGALGRTQAMATRRRYRERAQLGKDRVVTTAGAVLVRFRGLGKKRRGSRPDRPDSTAGAGSAR